MADCCSSLAASLRHRVTIQNNTPVPDGQGGQTDGWSDLATVYASIDPVKGYERYQAMQMQTPVTHKIVMRYRTGVTTASRIQFGTRIFWVVEVLNQEERNRYLIIKAIERA